MADTHLFHRELVVPDGDVFIHAGDMCRGGDLAEMAEAAAFVHAQRHRHKIVVAGNHDWAFAEDRSRHEARALFAADDVIYLEDSGAVIKGIRFWGSPWQPEYNAWAFNLPRGEPLREKWSLIPEDTHVLITHGPPMGIGDRSSMSGRFGCADLRERVLSIAPKVHLFGHIHDDGGAFPVDAPASGKRIVFLNVTTWECERPPTVFDIDERTLEVTLVTIPRARRPPLPPLPRLPPR